MSLSSGQAMLDVARPPTTRTDAFALSGEHFAFCPDIVTQGAGTVSDLAAMLLGGPTWTF